MRTPRVVILVFFCLSSLFLLCRSLASIGHSAPATNQASQSTLRALLAGSFNLFPPSAAISLTEDNSTSFPGRPAAYGPPLPNKGISGQLWIGIGFSEDIGKGGDAGEGELGCSDVPGWDEKSSSVKAAAGKALHRDKSAVGSAAGKARRILRGRATADADKPHRPDGSVDDGTDDYLHEDIPSPDGEGSRHAHSILGPGPTHADIQSLQEAAEISGKIVLLSRGGCGFLEKTMWAQRRGAIALIVGDNMRGGPLIQMFAHGNVDNVSIPSVFTSRTTAHLLSSLVEAGALGGDIVDETGHPVLKVQHTDKSKKNRKFARRTLSKTEGSAGRTPGAETHRGASDSSEHPSVEAAETADEKSATDGSTGGSHGGLLSKLFGEDDGADFESPPKTEDSEADDDEDEDDDDENDDDDTDQPHGPRDGLWVTITPTRSGIPFFDTLVLVLISPMITLALVYALLTLRGFVRRRRWRAPKSLVARLPVRTYRTVEDDSDDSSTSSTSSRHPSPTAAASPTTPLLQPAPSRLSPRPRSNTTTAVPDSRLRLDPVLQASSGFFGASPSDSARTPSRTAQVEKTKANQWKKFKGRQLECVICLEEYIDGVSKVMSLPCGHEFHADCITPWLTTRRRTCPICKGDVVRSLALGFPSSSREVVYGGDSDDDDDWSPIHVETSDPFSYSVGDISPRRPRSPEIYPAAVHGRMIAEDRRHTTAPDARNW